ncbi:MAG: glycosyltransferase 87 family protein [Ignisphaera sp.]
MYLQHLRIVTVFAISIIVLALSYYLHIPNNPPPLDNVGLMYTDIVYGLFNPIFRDIVNPDGTPNGEKINNRWFNNEVAMKLIASERLCPIPYKDYKFEYPPIIGLIWFITTCTSIHVTLPERYTGSEYYRLSEAIAEKHYILQSIIIATFFIITMLYMYRVASICNSSLKRIILFVILPSTILYTIYNWDIIAVAFMVMALYYLVNEKYLFSGLLLGLSISTKLLPLLFALILVYDILQKYRSNNFSKQNLVNISIGLIIAGALPYLAVMFVSYNGFTYFIDHHYRWYCENCIYSIITQNVWSPYNRVYAMVLVTVFLLITASIDIDFKNPKEVLTIALISVIISTALNYVFSPQMMLLVSSIAVLILPLRQLVFLVIADVANFGIMYLFFKDLEARQWLSKYLGINMRLEYAPHTPDSPVQIVAMIRNIILILILLECIYTILKTKHASRISIVAQPSAKSDILQS